MPLEKGFLPYKFSNGRDGVFTAPIVNVSGGLYRGGMMGNLMEGRGEYFQEKSYYIGEFRDGNREGHGRLVKFEPESNRFTIYEGEFMNS